MAVSGEERRGREEVGGGENGEKVSVCAGLGEGNTSVTGAMNGACEDEQENRAGNGKEKEEMVENGGRTGGTWIVSGLPRQWQQDRFESFLRKVKGKGVRFVSCRKTPKSVSGLVVFAYERDAVHADALLRSVVIKGKTLRVEKKAYDRSAAKHGDTERRGDAHGPTSGVGDVRDSVAPLWRITYDLRAPQEGQQSEEAEEKREDDQCQPERTHTTQLDVKQAMVIKAMRRVTQECAQRFAAVPTVMHETRMDDARSGPSHRCADVRNQGEKEKEEEEEQRERDGKRKRSGADATSRTKGEIPAWISEAVANSGMPGSYMGIVRSPIVNGYRNKVEFSIGPGSSDGLPAVGFNVGLFKDGHASVAEPSQCPHISPLAKALARSMQTYMRTTSALPSWDKRVNAGFWRLLIVREASGTVANRRPDAENWKAHLIAPLLASSSSSPETAMVNDPDGGGAMTTKRTEPTQKAATPSAGKRSGGNGGGADDANAADIGVDFASAARIDCAPITCGELMVVVQISPSGVDPELVRGECAALADTLDATARAEGQTNGISILLAQHHDGVANRAPDNAPLAALRASDAESVATDNESADKSASSSGTRASLKQHIHETLCGLRFRISPTSFFQVNTLAAETLYAIAGDWAVGADTLKRTLLVDVCSGTGTIGLSMAHRVGKVIGIESCGAAVRDAQTNARLNKIENAKFVCGKAEDALSRLLHANTKRYKSGHESGFPYVVAIVDPPRCGLHKRVLKCLRNCRELTRLVYISCNPESCASDVIALCSPKGEPQPQEQQQQQQHSSSASKRQRHQEQRQQRDAKNKEGDREEEEKEEERTNAVAGSGDAAAGNTDATPAREAFRPFVPVRLAAVDLFPYAKHCESITLLERAPQSVS